jgi:SAM-dependent methyltransferase
VVVKGARMTVQSSGNALHRVYPEVGAGGFSHVDGTVDFYIRIAALLDPAMTVLDFGAGRGSINEDTVQFRASLTNLKGRVAKLVGVDIDSAVLENPLLDEAHVISPDKPLPFADGTFDLIFSDWVLEHVATPEQFEAEAWRVLKPGGWFCARTPNRWGLTGIGANIVPNSQHVKMLSVLQPERRDIDVFPTTYKLNTRGRLRRYFTAARWDDFSYIQSPEPAYFLESGLLTRIVRGVLKLAPEPFGLNLHVFLRKKTDADEALT